MNNNIPDGLEGFLYRDADSTMSGGALILTTPTPIDTREIVDFVLNYINSETGSHFKADYSLKDKDKEKILDIGNRGGFSKWGIGFAIDEEEKTGTVHGPVPISLRIEMGDPKNDYIGDYVEISANSPANQPNGKNAEYLDITFRNLVLTHNLCGDKPVRYSRTSK